MGHTLLITGGAGFVGSNLALAFKRDHPAMRVIALDNLKRRGSELSLPRLREAGVAFVHGDIRNREDLEAVGPFDWMIECSAEPSVLAGYQSSPAYLLHTNLTGTINCLEAVRRCRGGIIFLSTSRVYPMQAINRLRFTEAESRFVLEDGQEVHGVSPQGITEDFPLGGPRSLYGATKLASELLLTEYIDMYGVQGIINRCGVIAGPWQMGKVDQGVVVLWVASHIFETSLNYLGYGGSGKQVRDVLHIDDLYRLLAKQLNALSRYSGATYNVGGGLERSVSLCELTLLCQKVTGKQIPIGRIPENRAADIPWYVTDNTKVHAETGWAPRKSVEETVAEIGDWIRSHADALRSVLQGG